VDGIGDDPKRGFAAMAVGKADRYGWAISVACARKGREEIE
jgi:hypothetical protein